MQNKTYIFSLTVATVVVIACLIFIASEIFYGTEAGEQVYVLLGSCLAFIFGLQIPPASCNKSQVLEPTLPLEPVA